MIHDGYRETIQDGISAVNRFTKLTRGRRTYGDSVDLLREKLDAADRIVVGAGAGLSTAAGFTYSGKRFEEYFHDFRDAYGITDMYYGGFYPFPSDRVFWAWWSRHIYCNRYIDAPVPVYRGLLSLLDGKDYFVITTNVDHQFQRAGFPKERLFYTQGDYGLFQHADGSGGVTYDNENVVTAMMEAQGFVRDGQGIFRMPADSTPRMEVPEELIPRGPNGEKMTMNLRSDDTFVEDAGWRDASDRYYRYLQDCRGRRTLFLEIGVGNNTPVIIKYPFWHMTWQNPLATYACINFDDAVCPLEIADRSVCLTGDAADVIRRLL